MGESTTGTGRMILKHQCRTVSELLGDGYDVDFPLYDTPKTAAEKGKAPEVALSGPVYKGEFQSDSVIYGDTDSTYFKTYAADLQEAITIADTVADGVNRSYPKFMQDMFLCQPGFDDIIKAGREIVSDNGIFVDKKRYILHIADMEGKAVDKMKVMGLDTKKTTLPKAVADKLNGFIEQYLKGVPWSDISKQIVQYKDELRGSGNLMDIGLPGGVNGIEEQTAKYEIQGRAAALPGRAAAAIFYNIQLREHNDKVSPEIMSGMKVKVFYLDRSFGKFKSIAIPTDVEVVPAWFMENFNVNYDMHLERLVDNPLENILKAIGKRSPTKQDMIVESLFGF
jgi:DNA polymerase elongation subunit (family B)